MLAVLLRWHVRVIESVRGLMLMMLPTTLPPLERDLLLSAALVSLALFGAFVSCAGVKTVDVSTPKVFMGLNVGAMLLYWFSAMTMKSVGSAALKMEKEVRRQFNTIPGLMEGLAKPDYTTCENLN
ncbi:putative inorganic diphosphatase [Helianthus debilis subsp. tardiflorus]